MKLILFLIFNMALLACQSKDNVTPQKPLSDKSRVSPSTVMVKDTLKRPPQVKQKTAPKKRRSRTYVSTARASQDINTTYPYDITLKTKEGKEVKSNEVFAKNGKPTVLLFWLSTCLPCAMEMKAISEKYASWEEQADFNLYAISTDFDSNFSRFVSKIDKGNWPWKSYNDMNRDFKQFLPGGLNGLPQTFLLDGSGKIVYHKRKYRPGDEDVLFQKIQQLATSK